ncbi:MAG: ABC transporter substrate-binding protein [Balneolaceae bacterium]
MNLTKKKIFCVLVILLIASVTIYSAGKKEVEQDFSEKITRGGTFTMGIMNRITSLDPANGNAYSGEGNVYPLLYDRLLRKDLSTGAYIPELATSWEFSSDGKQLTLFLRKGVTFHDGTPFNAAAVKFNLDRSLDPTDATQAYTYFTYVDSIEVIDDYTVRINMKQPSAVILDALIYRGGFILSPTAMTKYKGDYNEHPAGTGPFKFVEWIPGISLTVVKNENYWDIGEDGQPLPYLDKIVFKVIADDSVRIVELQTGAADLIVRVPSHSMDVVSKYPNLDLVKSITADTFRLYLNMRKAPYNNLLVRQAINYAFDRNLMAERLTPKQGAVHPFLYLPEDPAYSQYNPYSYDPSKAVGLLNKAGFDKGFKADLMIIAREPDNTLAPAIQSYLEDIGIQTKILSLERLAFVDRGISGDFDIALAQSTIPLPSNFIFLSQQLRSDGPVNRAAWNNKEFDKLLDTLSVTNDLNTQSILLKELQKVCLDDAGQTFLFTREHYDARHTKVHNLEFSFEGSYRLNEVWISR